MGRDNYPHNKYSKLSMHGQVNQNSFLFFLHNYNKFVQFLSRQVIANSWSVISQTESPSNTMKNCMYIKNLLCFLVAHHHLLDLSNGTSWVQALRTSLGAVHDGVAAVNTVAILHLGEALFGEVITRVDHPPVGLHEDSWAQVFV